MSALPNTGPRVVSVLQVARPALWDELAAACEVESHLAEPLGPDQRVARASFHGLLGALKEQGLSVLVRHARRTVAEIEEARTDLAERIATLPKRTQAVLIRAQNHHRDGVVVGAHCWDPQWEAEAVDTLHGAGLIESMGGSEAPRHGRYRLNPDLPPPTPRVYDFHEAVMERTDDLSTPVASPLDLLHDLAALSAAIHHDPPRRTLSGSLQRADVRKLGRWLGSKELADGGALEQSARWGRALAALEALGAVSMDPIARTLYAEPHLESVLEGDAHEALDRLVRRLVERDLQAALPAVRSALAAAGDGAVDSMIFFELLEEQHRDVLFAPWLRDGEKTYPTLAELPVLPWSPEAFEKVEGRMIRELFAILLRLGLIQRAPGVFAATEAGKLWARAADPEAAPVWVSSDLEVMVPPHSITPWERYQLERLGRCLSRDVVDRYRLERAGLDAWLATHDLEQALELLRRRSPGLPDSVVQTLTEWHRSATRFVLTIGVLLTDG